jgi:hypothetical protein
MAVKERNNSEKKIDHNSFKLKIGTTNRNNPIVVYIEGRTYISPNIEKETYDRDIYDMKRSLKTSISNNIKENNLFDGSFILDFQVAQNGVSKNKKSFLSFQFLLKQEKDRVLKLKDVKKEALETINKIVGSLENSILEHDFSIYKNKNS